MVIRYDVIASSFSADFILRIYYYFAVVVCFINLINKIIWKILVSASPSILQHICIYIYVYIYIYTYMI